jgi:hypothetical protein
MRDQWIMADVLWLHKTMRLYKLTAHTSGLGIFKVPAGVTHAAQEFCEYAFGKLELDCRDQVKVDFGNYLPPDSVQLLENTEK